MPDDDKKQRGVCVECKRSKYLTRHEIFGPNEVLRHTHNAFGLDPTYRLWSINTRDINSDLLPLAITIPADLIENHDDEFFEEISEVNDFLFGNVLVTGDTSCENNTDTNGESDNDSQGEGSLELNVDDARQTDVTEHNVTNQFRRITCGCTRSQIFYLIDEVEQTGKGANSVATPSFFIQRLRRNRCSPSYGQLLRYGLWRVMTGQHDSISFSLKEAGHTKFHPGWHFGLWKIKWRTTTLLASYQKIRGITWFDFFDGSDRVINVYILIYKVV
ncbi:hypothetical protein KUTeg_011181 [Tegillarca granosa]|uniref:Uncharacterized protein n=1 Tax=Tegillarca granosa TaxID=220873 RepID=A0ABQ9F3X0_TEGGR|nr:hypothetical protein KUTeg_011181 [Tegillarca granosa]